MAADPDTRMLNALEVVCYIVGGDLAEHQAATNDAVFASREAIAGSLKLIARSDRTLVRHRALLCRLPEDDPPQC